MMDADPLLKELKQALESFDSDRCLQLARQLSDVVQDMDGILLVATAFLEVGQPSETLQRIKDLQQQGSAAPGYDEDLNRVLLHRNAEALFLTGDPQGALTQTMDLEPSDSLEASDREFFLGLCHDHLRDPESADEHFTRSTELDPVGNPPIPEITPDEAHDLIARVLGELPENIRKELEEVPIILEDLPELSMIQESAGQISPDTLGLYCGNGIGERHMGNISSHEGMPTMASIRIYRRNLERMSRDEEDLVKQVKITLLHEIGHHLGLDEDDISQLGLA